MTAEADLWAAVVALAKRDACDAEKLAKSGGCATAAPTKREALEAWAFLTAGGEWGAHREWVTGLAGVEPGLLRAEAIRRGPARAVRAAMMQEEIVERKASQFRGPDPQTAIRNRALALDYAAGMPTAELVAKYGLTASTVKKRANEAGAKRPASFISATMRESALDVCRTAARNDEITRRFDAGERAAQIARAMGLPFSVAHKVIERHRKLAGSAVDARGGSRAAGGGGVSISFHAQTMQDD